MCRCGVDFSESFSSKSLNRWPRPTTSPIPALETLSSLSTPRFNATFPEAFYLLRGRIASVQMGPIDREIQVTQQTTGETASIRQVSRSRKRAYTEFRSSTAASNGGCEGLVEESHAATHKPTHAVREVEKRCREIIDAFGLYPLNFREGRSRRV